MTSSKGELRLRVFAGPNGSGKSAIVNEVRQTKVNGYPLDIGMFINADDIGKALSEGSFSFKNFDIEFSKKSLLNFADSSGLLDNHFDFEDLKSSITLYDGIVKLKDAVHSERVAQIIARYLRELMLSSKKRFSFETVFSHDSNIDFMRRAQEAGYKVYLYYVATENPEINKYRVALRVAKGGHNVPEDKIVDRYYRSLNFLFEAAEVAYQSYFFDNSKRAPKLVNHFKVIGDEKVWDTRNSRWFPFWFKKYYWSKL